MSATLEGMGHHILLSVKMTLNAIINMFSAFLYHYIDSSVLYTISVGWLHVLKYPIFLKIKSYHCGGI